MDPEQIEEARLAFEERAAIMEYDGGLCRELAELCARAHPLPVPEPDDDAA
jgi:hypothetical protein